MGAYIISVVQQYWVQALITITVLGVGTLLGAYAYKTYRLKRLVLKRKNVKHGEVVVQPMDDCMQFLLSNATLKRIKKGGAVEAVVQGGSGRSMKVRFKLLGGSNA